MRKMALIAALALGVAAPAVAAIGTWYDDSARGLSVTLDTDTRVCAIHVRFTGGGYVALAYSQRDDQFHFVVEGENLRHLRPEPFIQVRFAGVEANDYRGDATRSTYPNRLIVAVPPSFVAHLARGTSMSLWIDGDFVGRYTLRGTLRATEAMFGCIEFLLGEAA